MTRADWDALSARERNQLVETGVFGTPVAVIPDGMAATYSSDTLSDQSELWAEVVNAAIAAGVELLQTGSYKGVTYGATFRGWRLTYSLGYSDSYRASDTIRLSGVANEWACGLGDGLFVSPADPRPFTTSWDAMREVVEKMATNPDPKKQTLRLVAYPYNRCYATFDMEADSEDWSEANGTHAVPEAVYIAALTALGHMEAT